MAVSPGVTETPPVAPSEPEGGIKQLRDHVSKLEGDLKAQREAYNEATTKLTTLEREKMSEVERISAERDEARMKAQDADRLKAENDKNASTFDSLFKARLDALPPEARAGVEAATSKLESPSDKFEALVALETTFAAIKPSVAGTATQPSTAGTSTQPATAPVKTAPVVDMKSVTSGNVQMGWKPIPGQPGYEG